MAYLRETGIVSETKTDLDDPTRIWDSERDESVAFYKYIYEKSDVKTHVTFEINGQHLIIDLPGACGDQWAGKRINVIITTREAGHDQSETPQQA